jgi:flagellar basal-body rod protein FlgB
MWFDRILHSPARQAVEFAAKFAERRHGVLVENVANIDTPDYHMKRLDPDSFHTALRDSLQRGRPGQELRLSGRQVSSGADGRVSVRARNEPAANVLFHDGTNARLETLMTDVQDNAQTYDLMINLLKGRFSTLLTAIRGRSS